MKKQKIIVDVYMICNKTDEKLPTKKAVLVEVEHINGKKMGCLNKINAKLDEMFYNKDVRPRGFEWTD